MAELRADFDVIVVGAGAAGIPAAIEAARAGARVAVVEKTTQIGGGLLVSGGHFSGAGTRRQTALGIEDGPEAHLEDVMAISHGLAERELVRIAVEEATRTVDWLDELGFPFAPNTPTVWYSHEPYRVARTYWGPNNGRSVLETMRPAFDQAIASGGVKLLLECPMTELITAGRAVVGLLASSPQGTLELRAPAVILASGGYAANLELLGRDVPDARPLVTGAPPHATGDGRIAAAAVGVAVRDGRHQLGNPGGIETQPGSQRVDVRKVTVALSPQYRTPREITVNEHGERFVAEDEPSVDLRERRLAAQPGQRAWTVFDERAIPGDPLVPGWGEAGLRAAAAAGWQAWSAPSVAELAVLAGIDPVGLSSTVEGWNRAVSGGGDALGRTTGMHPIQAPPFYALRWHATHLVSFGGLMVDLQMRALDGEGRVVEGLWIVGEAVGVAALMGDAFAGGMCVTPAISLGRRVGAQLGERFARQLTSTTTGGH
jgi:fumarate reductase flavoprotein subunit